MSRFRLFLFVVLLCSTIAAPAQSSVASGKEAALLPIRDYIRHAWNTLSRSMTECKSVRDPKIAATPILYLPSGMPIPPEVAKLRVDCGVDVEHLPRKIENLGDLSPGELKRPGLLYLPNRYVVPGGRFNEMYGWDSYFIVLGLLSDGRMDLAKGMVENFLFELEHYGALLNANRTYYFTRSQPPLLAEMIREVNEQEAHAGKPSKRTARQQKAWLKHSYTVAQKDYALWMSPAHQAGDTGLARYFDLGAGPVVEMADDSTYYQDIIRYLSKHRDEDEGYLVPASEGDAASCDRTASQVCRRAEVNQMRLSSDFYRGDRAMRESGFDTSFRFGAFSGSTHHFAPVCLNSLLYRYEVDMAGFAKELGRTSESNEWFRRAKRRQTAMARYLWEPSLGGFFDYDFTTQKRSTYLYATAFYPLWAGLATSQQATGTASLLRKLERTHGLSMSDRRSGMQWDEPFGWAPEHYFAVMGLRRYGFTEDAGRISGKFRSLVEANYRREGTMREKYDVEQGDTEARILAGYKSNAVGFGWTNGVYLRLLEAQ